MGVGASDTFEQAQQFLERYGGKSMPMYWERSGKAWAAVGVRSQPSLVLTRGDGEIIERWNGSVPLDKALARLATL